MVAAGKLVLVGDRQRRAGLLEPGDRRQRRLHAAELAGEIELVERARIVLVVRRSFEDHAILVRLRVDRRDLPLAERVVERIVDVLRAHPQTPGGVAVDADERAQSADLRFGGEIAQDRRCLQPLGDAVAPIRDLVGVGADQRVLVLRAARARRNLDVLNRLHIQVDADRLVRRALQPVAVSAAVAVRSSRGFSVTARWPTLAVALS